MTDTTESPWRWIDQDGRPMTNWSTKPAPPPHVRNISDFRGTMRVQFQSEVTETPPCDRD